jgi:hypothetical protein
MTTAGEATLMKCTLSFEMNGARVTIEAPDDDRLLAMLELVRTPGTCADLARGVPTGCSYHWKNLTPPPWDDMNVTWLVGADSKELR